MDLIGGVLLTVIVGALIWFILSLWSKLNYVIQGYRLKEEAVCDARRQQSRVERNEAHSKEPLTAHSFSDYLTSIYETTVQAFRQDTDLLEDIINFSARSDPQILFEAEYEQIQGQKPTAKRARYLLKTVKRKGELACHLFINVLFSTSPSLLDTIPPHLKSKLSQISDILSIDKWMSEMKQFYEDMISKNVDQERSHGNCLPLGKHKPILIARELKQDESEKRKFPSEKEVDAEGIRTLTLEQMFKGEKPARSVLILGVPGVGKTSTCYKILKNFASGTWKPHKYVFFLSLKMIAVFPEVMNLTDLLFDYCGSIKVKDKCKLQRQLEASDSKVLIILDGYDECVHFMEHEVLPTYLASTNLRKEVILQKLVCRQFPPKADVMITSRFFKEEKLADKVDKIVKLNGLAKKDVLETIKDALGQEARDFVENNMEITGLLSYPINLQKVVSYLDNFKKDPQTMIGNFPDTKTSLYCKTFSSIFRQLSRDLQLQSTFLAHVWLNDEIKATVKKLMKLAEMTMNSPDGSKITFSENELKLCGLSDPQVKSGGLLTSYTVVHSDSTDCLQPHRVIWYYFVQRSTLEWFGGMVVAGLSMEEIRKLVDENQGQTDAMFVFALGLLSNEDGQHILKHIFGMSKDMCTGKGYELLQALLVSKRCSLIGGVQFSLELFMEGKFDDPGELFPFPFQRSHLMHLPGIAKHNMHHVKYFFSKVKHAIHDEDSLPSFDAVCLGFSQQSSGGFADAILDDICQISGVRYIILSNAGENCLEGGACYKAVLMKKLDLLIFNCSFDNQFPAAKVLSSQARILCLNFMSGCFLPEETKISGHFEELHIYGYYMQRKTLNSIDRRSHLRALTGILFKDDKAEDLLAFARDIDSLNALGIWLESGNETKLCELTSILVNKQIECLTVCLKPQRDEHINFLVDIVKKMVDLKELWIWFFNTPSEEKLRSVSNAVGESSQLNTLACMCDEYIKTDVFIKGLPDSAAIKRVFTSQLAAEINNSSLEANHCEVVNIAWGDDSAFFTPLVYSRYFFRGIPQHVKDHLSEVYVKPKPIRM